MNYLTVTYKLQNPSETGNFVLSNNKLWKILVILNLRIKLNLQN